MGFEIMKKEEKYSRKHLENMVNEARINSYSMFWTRAQISVEVPYRPDCLHLIILDTLTSSRIRKKFGIEDELHMFRVDEIIGKEAIRIVYDDNFIVLENEKFLPIHYDFYRKYQKRIKKMAKMKNKYNPDVVYPPSSTLREKLKEMGISQDDFTKRLGLPHRVADGILNGDYEMTPDVIAAISKITGISEDFWSNAQDRYREFEDKTNKPFDKLLL